jgi:cytochrome d ubiquinol oxidase subunit I
MFGLESIDLSRIQFAYTVMVHFLFVPLTLGLSLLMALMESIYVKTKNPIYKDMTKFWGVLFAINFAMGVATGIPMEFQFGTNWSYYAHYVGDIFGAPLAIEGAMAFFLEGTFIGLFFFGWDKLSPKKHLMATWLLFLGTNFSGLWILVANGWMQFPTGAYFNLDTMRMEMLGFFDVIFNPAAQWRFLHTLTSAYILASLFVIAVSSYYLLKGRNIAFAKRSVLLAAFVGVVATIITAYAGHSQGQLVSEVQPAKFVAMEGNWEKEEYPQHFTLFAIPLQKEQKNIFEIQIPYALGLVNGENILSAKEVIAINEGRIKSGIIAYKALQEYKKDKSNQESKDLFEKHVKDLGYALLLNKVSKDIINATEAEIKEAAILTIPNVLPVFFAFRLMVGMGILFLLFFVVVFIKARNNTFATSKFWQVSSLILLPLPWLAIQLGWFVAEYGRQPWVIQDILPTFKGASNLPAAHVAGSLIGFFVIYTVLIIVDVILMVRQVKKGPDLAKNTKSK